MTSNEELDALEEKLKKDELVEIILLSDAAAKADQDTSTEISSGFVDIDGCMKGGFREGDFNVITGIPGEGKTTLARMFTLNFAEKGIPSLWFSHEMSNKELWDSFSEMGADTSMIAYVPETLENDLDWMFRHIQAAIDQHGIKAVFIDTIGDVVKTVKRGTDIPNYSTYLEHICKGIRDFGVKNGLITTVVAHATKQTRSNSNETTNADIAHSNGIPATATNIFHVWRDTESDSTSYVKIGKSRRDGSKKNWKFEFQFDNGRLHPIGRKLDVQGEDVWKSHKKKI